jgi:hypothetical protein
VKSLGDHCKWRSGLRSTLIRRSHRFGAAAAVLVATSFVSFSAAETAEAKPRQPAGVNEYYSCISDQIQLVKKKNGGSYTARDMYNARFDCCITLGGTSTPGPDANDPLIGATCNLPDGSIARPDDQSSGGPPLPGAVLPPGLDTRAGIQ